MLHCLACRPTHSLALLEPETGVLPVVNTSAPAHGLDLSTSSAKSEAYAVLPAVRARACDSPLPLVEIELVHRIPPTSLRRCAVKRAAETAGRTVSELLAHPARNNRISSPSARGRARLLGGFDHGRSGVGGQQVALNAPGEEGASLIRILFAWTSAPPVAL